MRKPIHLFFLLFIPILFFISWKKESIIISHKEKTKNIKLFEGAFTVPYEWRLISNKNDSLLIAGTDTITFSREMPNVFIPVLMLGYLYDDADSAHLAENRKIKIYNDSLIKAEPKILTHCMDNFHAKNSSYWFAYLFPCKEVAGKLYANIFIQKGGIIGVTTSAINSARAVQFIEILKTFRVKK
jgi:hypothetical protein